MDEPLTPDPSPLRSSGARGELRASSLFVRGCVGSFIFNLALIGFGRWVIEGQPLWQLALVQAVAVFVVFTLPLIGGMAIVSWLVQRQSDRRLAVRRLRRLGVASFVVGFVSVLLSVWVISRPMDGAMMTLLLFALEVVYVGFTIAALILLNRVVTMRGANTRPVYSPSEEDG